MVFYDSGLLSINGQYTTSGANSQVDVENIAYVIPSRGQLQDGTFVETFMMVLIQNKGIGGVQIQYQRNGRTIDDFLDAINSVGSGAPLKLWTNLRKFNGLTYATSDSMYDVSVIINDACQQGGRYISSQGQTMVQVRIQNSLSLLTFQFDGDQIGSAPIIYSITVPVYDGLSAQGTTSSTTSVLQYGVNVFTTVTPTNYAAKLPQPITGKSVKIVNKGSVTLSLFPSNVGGQINNYPIDYPAQIPPDGVVYEFTCIENPLPGAWTWTPPATTQYDSGDVTCNTTGGNNVIRALNTANFGEGDSFYASTGWGYDGKNKSPILSGTFGGFPYFAMKEAVLWQGITKIKVYTNLSSTNANVTFGVNTGSQITLYEPGTNNIVNTGVGGAGNYGSIGSGYYGYCDQSIPGATLAPNALTSNIGDAGTCWGEFSILSGTNGVHSQVGDLFIGNIVNPYTPPPTTVDSWLSAYFVFGIQPRVALTGFMFRFFIEHY